MSTPVPALALGVAVAAPLPRVDLSGPVDARYRAGLGAYRLVCSSIQCRRNPTALWLEVVVPAAPEGLYDDLLALIGSPLAIYRTWIAGGVVYPEHVLLEAELSAISEYRGSGSASLSLSAQRAGAPSANRPRTLSGVSYRASIGGVERVRCAFDPWISPGDQVEVAPGELLTVGSVSWQLSADNAVLELAI